MAMSSLAATSQPVLELVAIYVYDAFNRRVGRFVNQVSYFSYTWDGWHEAEEYRNTVLGSQYVWGEELDELVAYRHRASANWARYYVAEGLAHCPSRILDESGTVCEIQEYDPYGKTYRFTGNGAAIDVSAVGNPFGWKGHRVDGETGFIYIRNRYYRSDWGRFLSQDPSGAWFDSLNHGNAYAYGGNQPWLIDDRNGHFGWFGALVGAVVGGVVNGVIAAATGGSLRDVGKAILTGAAGGAVVGSGATLVAAVFTGAASGVVAEATGQAIDGKFSGEGLATAMVTGAGGGLVGGLAAKGTAAVVQKVAGKLREGPAATVASAANAAPKAAAGKAASGAVDQAADQVGKKATPVPNPCPQRTVGQSAPPAKKWASDDPHVADVANAIEDAYPGHVRAVNQEYYAPDGRVIAEADVLLENAVIQVKSGGGKGLGGQLERTEAALGLPTLGYGPDLKGSIVSNYYATRSLSLLVDVVRP
jgi:RHS repeat-associated protein